MSIGATPGNVFFLIFRQGLLTVATGIPVGLGPALICMRSVGSMLVGFESGDPAFIRAAATLVTSTAGIACWIPARLATRTDPISARHQE